MSDHEVLIPCTVDGALTALRHMLEHERPDAREFDRIADPIRLLCSRARDEGVAPERLLVRLKATLDFVPGFHGGLLDTPEMRLRERIVSCTIDAYFSGAGG